ncbi:DUF6404 family protein [Escherichia coli]|uniref:DUF6404 family protein n=1 Tax=Escherichia coli TaxID=562 RepID=UPI0039905C1B
MTFEQKKARAIALMDSKKMWRSNYAPPLLRILWRLGIRLPPLPFMPFWQVTVLTGGLWGISWGCAMWFIYWGPSGYKYHGWFFVRTVHGLFPLVAQES